MGRNNSNTKKVEVEVPEKFTRHLVAFLAGHPHVQKVWVNEQGEYHLHAVEGFEEFDVADIFSQIKDVDAFIADPVSTGGGEAAGSEGGEGGSKTNNENTPTGGGEAK
jgi:hypothetical protein